MQNLCLKFKATPFPLADANGNCVSFINHAGNVQAHYTYDAFGNTVSQTGAMAADFRFRFSSKYLDEETGLYYYGYRFYDSGLGRWVNRDPIEEDGGILMYAFIDNNGLDYWDYMGMTRDPVERIACLQASLELPGLNSDGGNPICYGGVLVPCVFYDGRFEENATARKIVLKCMQDHENKHVEHAKCTDNCSDISPVQWRDDFDLRKSECMAYTVSFDCLTGSINQCNGDKDCIREVENEIKRVMDFLFRFQCKVPEYESTL